MDELLGLDGRQRSDPRGAVVEEGAELADAFDELDMADGDLRGRAQRLQPGREVDQ